MVNIWQLCPGDVIHRCNVSAMDQDVPLMVLACRQDSQTKWHMGSAVQDPVVHVYGIYMVESGYIHLREIVIDCLSAYDYEWIISHAPQRGVQSPSWR